MTNLTYKNFEAPLYKGKFFYIEKYGINGRMEKKAFCEYWVCSILMEGSTKMISIKELKSNEERQLAYPVMNQLRAHLHEEEYLNLVIEAAEKEGYRQFGLFEGDEIVAVIGFQPNIILWKISMGM